MSPPAHASLPLIGLPTDSIMVGPHPFQAAGEKYIRAVSEAAGLLPVLIPSMLPETHLPALVDTLDGLLLTGSRSNVEPHHYGDEESFDATTHDPQRDSLTLPLIRLAVERGLPVLAICRGLQEVNVALGGTLHQQVHAVDGMADHREDYDADLDVRYGAAHAVRLAEDGLLAEIAGTSRVAVNSLHGQGIARLADGMTVEACAMDGLIEAFRLRHPDRFLLAVQWHPEWKVRDNPFYLGIFERFATACRAYAAHKTSQP